MGRRPLAVLVLLGLVAVAAGGCGYRLAGRAGAGLPSALALGAVQDEGDEPLFGALLGQALARAAVNRADAVLVGRGEARAVLDVRVDAVTETGAAFVVGDRVREYLLTGEVTATLVRPGGEVLWRGTGIRADREFAAGTSVAETEANKERALALLARDLSREVLRRAALAAEEAR